MTALRIIGSSTVLTALMAVSPGVVLADGPQAVATAAQHAGLAANGADIAAVHRHLHHVLNCLVGSDGEGFDAAAGNPCAAAGGAIPQTSDNAMKMKLEKAVAEARMGIANENLDAAKKTAMELQASLK
jgi:hypothetical protein